MRKISELKEFIKYGILDEESMRHELKMKKIEMMLKMHPHPITHLSNGRWQTYYDDPVTGKRKEIKKSSKEKVYDKLYEIYYAGDEESPAESRQATTIDELFNEWVEYKKKVTNSENTITRYIQLYVKYLTGSSIVKKDIREINKLELNAFCNELVKKHSLSLKGWMNIKTILNGVFGYAMDRDLITVNPLSRVKITVKFRQVNRKTDGSQCFNMEEIKDLTEYMTGKFATTEDVAYLAPPLQLLTGVRVGELVALKWEDVDFENHTLHVVREESRIRDTNQCIVVNHTKGNRDRFVCLVPQAEEYLKSIKAKEQSPTYIFARDGERLTARQITWIYEWYSRSTGHMMKRSHKSRKTYASVLHQFGVPIEKIREQLGHKDLMTTLGYIYNPLTDEQTYNQIIAALS